MIGMTSGSIDKIFVRAAITPAKAKIFVRLTLAKSWASQGNQSRILMQDMEGSRVLFSVKLVILIFKFSPKVFQVDDV